MNKPLLIVAAVLFVLSVIGTSWGLLFLAVVALGASAIVDFYLGDKSG